MCKVQTVVAYSNFTEFAICCLSNVFQLSVQQSEWKIYVHFIKWEWKEHFFVWPRCL